MSSSSLPSSSLPSSSSSPSSLPSSSLPSSSSSPSFSSPSFSTLQRLLAQFQTRYPMGCLISELLTVHEGIYAVRAVVQIGNVSWATGMATAPNLEAAEDRAKVRALEALAMTPLPLEKSIVSASSLSSWTSPSFEPVESASPQPFAEPLPSVDIDSRSIDRPPSVSPRAMPSNPSAVATTSPTPTPLSAWTPAVAPLPPVAIKPEGISSSATTSKTSGSVVADFYSHINADADEPSNFFNEELEEYAFEGDRPSAETALPPLSSAPPIPASPVIPSSVGDKPHRKPSSSPNLSTSTSVDLSDVIAQTDVELARLGWNKTQGREHLKQTYGKRSRQELDEAELYGFLHYLQEQA